MSALTPEQRSLRASLAAHEMHAVHDSKKTTAAARAVGPAGDAYWLKQIDPALPLEERQRRAGHIKEGSFLTALSSRFQGARKEGVVNSGRCRACHAGGPFVNLLDRIVHVTRGHISVIEGETGEIATNGKES